VRIYNNIAALQANGGLASTADALQRSISKLSSGLRIDGAADDAAGLAISEKMRAQVRGIHQAVQNSQDGISMIRTAEGALNESHSILQRMRELSVQAANDTLTSGDRAFIQQEIEQLKDELNRISTTTQFNRKTLLDGSGDILWATDREGANLNIRGNLLEKDEFGATTTAEGNYSVSVNTSEPGQNQVLKSNIFTLAMNNGAVITLGQNTGSGGAATYAVSGAEAVPAGKNTPLASVANFVDGNGRFLLTPPKQLTVSLEGGEEQTVTLYPSDTLGSLGEKLSGAVAAAGGMQMGAPAQFVGKGSVIPDMNDPILNGLATYWLEGAGQRILDMYGLDGNGKSLEVSVVPTLGGPLASASWSSAKPGVILLSVSAEDFLPATPPSGTNKHGTMYNDRIIAHEMAHAVMFADDNLRETQFATDGSGMWLIEGITEYLHGANKRVQADNAFGVNLGAAVNSLVTTASNNYAMYSAPGAYSAAYLAVRYFDEKSLLAGGTGIKGLLNELKAPGPFDNTRMDTAIATASGGAFTGRADLAAQLSADAAFINGVIAEDENVDTGAIGGLYASGGTPFTPEDIIGGSGVFKLNPLSGFGWTGVTWPESGGGGGFPMTSAISLSAAPVVATTTVSPAVLTLQSVEGTLLLHSSLAGKAGNISISGDEDLLKALGFTEVQSARETIYTATVRDAHSGETVASSVKFSGRTLSGAIHANVDVELPPNFALDAVWDGSGYGSYVFTNKPESFTAHIACNATVLQVGANEGEDMALSFGDVGARALGVGSLLVTSRDLASAALGAIDNAISRVSAMRARLGAYENRLEHTVNNLTVSGVNLSESESRIRDLDMAKEMMNFTRLNILMQAGNSMLAQANQLPENVLQLLKQ